MTGVMHRFLAAGGLTALLTAACSSFAVADIPHVDAREMERVLRVPEVLLPLREPYLDLGVPAPPSPIERQGLGNNVARSGVSLLTLWDSRGSNLSLLAGSHGTVSLQWTSKLFGRDAAPGLLNRLFGLAKRAP